MRTCRPNARVTHVAHAPSVMLLTSACGRTRPPALPPACSRACLFIRPPTHPPFHSPPAFSRALPPSRLFHAPVHPPAFSRARPPSRLLTRPPAFHAPSRPPAFSRALPPFHAPFNAVRTSKRVPRDGDDDERLAALARHGLGAPVPVRVPMSPCSSCSSCSVVVAVVVAAVIVLELVPA